MQKGIVKKSVLIIGLTACFSLYSVTGISQNIQTFTDRKDILIGEQISLKIKTTFQPGVYRLRNWFTVPDSVPNFEIVDIGKIDSLDYKDNSKAFEQTITITSFDSGRWVFPALRINLEPVKGDAVLNLFTDSFTVNVSYSPPDSTNQLRDIKPIIKVRTGPDYQAFLFWSALVILLISIIIWLIKRFRKKKTPLQFSGKSSAYDEAVSELDKLKQLNLKEPGDLKFFHSKLADIFKWYISRRQRFSIMNKTTGDVLVYLTEKNLSKEMVTETATVLRCGDAVKFAKYLPHATESTDCMDRIRIVINFIQQQPMNLPAGQPGDKPKS